MDTASGHITAEAAEGPFDGSMGGRDFESFSLLIKGMTCASCVGRVEKAIAKVPGVVTAEVNLATEKASVSFQPGTLDAADVRLAISKAGYEPGEVIAAGALGSPEDKDAETEALRHKFVFALFFTMPLLVVAMGKMAPGMSSLMVDVMV
ncbi:MAG: heavy-metal-associated domain-containing protein, partial [Rhodospirillales bacterium]|nr:heavy-metal-associated domain-containing protein [Rhodospirillales bacterium]